MNQLQNKLNEEREMAEFKARRSSREEISKLTIKYESLVLILLSILEMDQLKKKIENVKLGSMAGLSEDQ